MLVTGYFYEKGMGIYKGSISSYLSCEYYTGKLTGYERLLIPISNYIKGKIELDALIMANNHILLEERAKEMEKYELFPELVKSLAGLTVSE